MMGRMRPGGDRQGKRRVGSSSMGILCCNAEGKGTECIFQKCTGCDM